MNQVIFIGVLAFNSFEGDNYLTRHLILNRETMNQDLRDFEFNFIELKKFDRQEEELETIIEKWIYFIKNADNISVISKNAVDIPELNEAYKLASMNAWTEVELEIYEYWQIRDAGDRYKIQEEFEKGIELGKLEGKIEGKVEVALRLIDKGMSVEEAAEVAGMSVEVLKSRV